MTRISAFSAASSLALLGALVPGCSKSDPGNDRPIECATGARLDANGRCRSGCGSDADCGLCTQCESDGLCQPTSPCRCDTPADCADGDPCNGNELCTDNRCAPATDAVVCEVPTNSCFDNDCIDDGGVATCAVTPNSTCPCSNAGECDDSDPCNGTETCQDGFCYPGTWVECPATSQICRVNDCINVAGVAQCQLQEAPVDTACDSGEACHDVGTCDLVGDCIMQPRDCDDGIACTVDSCDTQTDACVNEANAGLCTDDDGISCTVAACDPVLGCVHEPDDDLCDDGAACSSDVCDPPSGDSVTGCAYTLQHNLCPTSADPCKVATCVVNAGCQDLAGNQDAQCNDGDSCTSHEACDQGECTGGVTRPNFESCDEGLFCYGGKCATQTSQSIAPPFTNASYQLVGALDNFRIAANAVLPDEPDGLGWGENRFVVLEPEAGMSAAWLRAPNNCLSSNNTYPSGRKSVDGSLYLASGPWLFGERVNNGGCPWNAYGWVSYGGNTSGPDDESSLPDIVLGAHASIDGLTAHTRVGTGMDSDHYFGATLGSNAGLVHCSGNFNCSGNGLVGVAGQVRGIGVATDLAGNVIDVVAAVDNGGTVTLYADSDNNSALTNTVGTFAGASILGAVSRPPSPGKSAEVYFYGLSGWMIVCTTPGAFVCQKFNSMLPANTSVRHGTVTPAGDIIFVGNYMFGSPVALLRTSLFALAATKTFTTVSAWQSYSLTGGGLTASPRTLHANGTKIVGVGIDLSGAPSTVWRFQ